MNKFVGKICPYCKTAFKETDNIVVCSECEMPHHADCWIQNEGCTTFGCTGTIKASDGTENTVIGNSMVYEHEEKNETVFCVMCGTKNTSRNAFCSSCGSPLKAKTEAAPAAAPQPAYTAPQQQTYTAAPQPTYTAPQQQTYTAAPQPAYTAPQQQTYTAPQPAYTAPQQQTYTTYTPPQQNTYQQQGYQQNTYQQGYQQTYNAYQNAALDNDFVQMIGEKKEYYVPKFQQIKATGKKISWNWPAFLITPFWLIYRKMYMYGGGMLVAALLTVIIPGLSIILLAAYVAGGLLGNFIYMDYLEKEAQKLKMTNEPFKSQEMFKKTGVSSKAVWIAVGAYIVLALICSL